MGDTNLRKPQFMHCQAGTLNDLLKVPCLHQRGDGSRDSQPDSKNILAKDSVDS